MSRGRGRKRKLISGESFVDELRREVDRSMTAEKDVLEAFRQLCSVQLSTDTLRSLPTKVICVYLSAKFDQHVLDFVTSSLAELDTLPHSLRNVTVAKLTGLSVDEVSIFFFCI